MQRDDLAVRRPVLRYPLLLGATTMRPGHGGGGSAAAVFARRAERIYLPASSGLLGHSMADRQRNMFHCRPAYSHRAMPCSDCLSIKSSGNGRTIDATMATGTIHSSQLQHYPEWSLSASTAARSGNAAVSSIVAYADNRLVRTSRNGIDILAMAASMPCAKMSTAKPRDQTAHRGGCCRSSAANGNNATTSLPFGRRGTKNAGPKRIFNGDLPAAESSQHHHVQCAGSGSTPRTMQTMAPALPSNASN